MKRVWEKIVEGILTCSGFITSITILLIVVFLFAEALGLFNKKVIEEGDRKSTRLNSSHP